MRLKIVRVNQCFFVDHWQSWMKKPLTGHKVELVKDEGSKNPRALKQRKVPCECFTINDATGEVLFYAGMLEGFVAEAERQGYSVEVVDGRDPNPCNLRPLLENVPDSLRYKQRDVLEAIMGSDKGIINCTVGYGKTFLMSNLCLIYPTARIVIVTAARELVKQIYDSLVKLLGNAEVGIVRGGTPSTEEQKRVVVSTCASLLRCPLKTCDFLFFDEAHNVGFNKTFETLIENLGPARCFGFSASPTRGDQAVDAMQALFGKVIATCTYAEAAEHHMVTPMHAFMPKFTCSTKIPVSADKTAAERANYWRNAERNAWIAEQAADAAAAFPEEQMLITVKTLEHALMLKKEPRLADWEIIFSGSIPTPEKIVRPYSPTTAPKTVHASDTRTNTIAVFSLVEYNGIWGYECGELFVDLVDASRYLKEVAGGSPVAEVATLPVKIAGIDVTPYKKTKKQVSEQVEAFAEGKILRAIATPMIKEGGNFYHLSHIFRADGSTSEVINTQFPGRASRVLETKPDAIIIDPYDDWNPWVRHRSEERMKIYKKHGWM